MLRNLTRLSSPVVLLAAAVLARELASLRAETSEPVRMALDVALWLACAFLINRVIGIFVWDGLVTRSLGRPVPSLMKDLSSAVIYSAASAAIVAYVFRESIAGFWATSSVVGVVLGFALRSVILDVFYGVAVNLDDAYRTNDWITVETGGAPVSGRVVEINWRTTRLRTEDNNIVVMANSAIGLSRITNLSQPTAQTRYEVRLCLDYSVPTDRARRVLLAAAKACVGPSGLNPEPSPEVLVAEADSLGVHYGIRYWIEPWGGISPSRARSLVIERSLDHLNRAGLTPAYPKEDIFHARMPERQLTGGSVSDRVALLRKVALFAELPGGALEEIERRLTPRRFAEGDALLRQGAPGDSLFVLVEGLLDVYVEHESLERGARVGQVEPGEFFGEMTLLTGEPRSATVVASTGVVAYEIGREAIQALLDERPELADTLSRAAARHRLEGATHLASLSASQRDGQTAGLARQILEKMSSFLRGVLVP